MEPNEQTSADTASAKVRVLPPFIFLGWFVLAIAVTHLWRHWSVYWLSGLRSLIGSILLFGGIAATIYCIRFMRETGQNPSPKTPTPTLITTGPWRVSRNPIYLSMAAVHIGFGLSVNNLWVIITGVLALLTVHRLAVLPEEAYLTEKFGDAYRQYQQKVHRYL